MSWITALWGILVGVCIAMALPHLLAGIWQRRPARLFFVAATIAVVGLAGCELWIMRSTTPQELAQAVRWMHVPIYVLTVSIVGFVLTWLRSGRFWLGLLVCGLRLVCLIQNFLAHPNFNFREIGAPKHVTFLHEKVAILSGVVSPWTYLGEFTSLLLILFLVDASITLFRRGNADDRRRAVTVAGGSVFAVATASAIAATAIHQWASVPLVISFPFAAVLAAMAFELGYDMFRAAVVVRRLQASEASLMESEKRFGAMADAAPVLIWMSGADKACTFFNKTWLEFTGRTMAQELGEGWKEGVHPDDEAQTFNHYVDAFDARKEFIMQYRLRRKDGEYRWITDAATPRFSTDGTFVGYIGACTDITDLLEQRKALDRYEERVALATDAAHLGVWELDTRTNKLWVSDKLREMFGFEPNIEITSERFESRIHPDDRKARETAVQKAIESMGDYEIEYRIIVPKHGTRWIAGRARWRPSPDAGGGRLIGVVMDITKRKQAEEMFRQVTEAAPSGILLVDSRGRMILVNEHIEEIFGYKREELVDQPIKMLLPPRVAADYAKQSAEFMVAPSLRSMVEGEELLARRKDGAEFPIEVRLNPIETSEGILVLAVVIDISARKAAEDEARQRREQIDLLSRVSLLGEMTASLAHELNQPLAAIVSNANAGIRFVDREHNDPAGMREIFVDVVADAHRATEIIRRVRNTIKKGQALRERIRLNDVVEHVAHSVQPEAVTHSCRIALSLADDLPEVEGDPLQIQQVLVNLVTNAFDAMETIPNAKRSVEISTARHGNGNISVAVRDHGVGIPKEVGPRLFEQFFTTKPEGLGMGLAIVRSIIRAHGGEIDAENVDGDGACFHFTLPISAREEKAA